MIPLNEFPDLIVKEKLSGFERPEFYLTSFPVNDSNKIFLRVFVENGTELEIPPFFVEFNLTQFADLTGADVVKTVVDALGFNIVSHKFTIGGKEIPSDQNSLQIFSEWKHQKALLTVELEPKALAQMTKRTYLLQEVVTTEQSYIDDLNTIDTFWRPAMEGFGIMTEGDLQALFKDIPAILNCHKSFLGELKKAGQNYGSEVGSIFLAYSQGFRVSQLYIGNYASLSQILRDYSAKPKFVQKLNKLTKKHDGKDLPSYLITPVQRLPRYVLLLRDILKCTPKSHPDSEFLQSAFNELDKLTKDIDVSSSIGKKAAGLMEVQKLIRNNFLIVKQHRELIFQTSIRVGASVIHKAGHAFLFNDLVVFTKSGDNSETVIFDSEIRCFPFRNQWPAVTSITVDSTGKRYLKRTQGPVEYAITFKTFDDLQKFVQEVEKLQQLMELKQGWAFPMRWKALSFKAPAKQFSKPRCLFHDDKVYILSTKGSGALLYKLNLQNGEISRQNTKITDVKCPCIVEHGRHIFIFATNKLVKYDPVSAKWESWVLSDIPPRRGQTVVVYGNYLCVFGGKGLDNEYRNDCYLINLNTIQVTELETTGEIPSPRWHHAAVFHDYMYICCGKGPDGLLNDMYCLDIEAKEWFRVDVTNLAPRKHHKLCVMGKYLVIVGGSTSNATQVVQLSNMEAIDCVDYGNCPPVLKYGDIFVEDKTRQILCVSPQNIYRLAPPAVVASEARTTHKPHPVDVSDVDMHRRRKGSERKPRVHFHGQDGHRSERGKKGRHRMQRTGSVNRYDTTVNRLDFCDSGDESMRAPGWSDSSSTEILATVEKEPEQPEVQVPAEEPKMEEPQPQQNEEKPMSTPTKIVIAAAAVIAIVGVGVLVYRRARRT